MNMPKFFPLVIEIVIDTDGKQSFIVRHTNSNVMAIFDDPDKISTFVKSICSQLSGLLPDNSSVEKVKKSVRAK